MNKDDKEYQEALLRGQPREGSYCEECRAYNGSEDCAPFGITRNDAQEMTEEYREKYSKLDKCPHFEPMYNQFMDILNKKNRESDSGCSSEIKDSMGILSRWNKQDSGYEWNNQGTKYFFREEDFKKILMDLKFEREAKLGYIAGENAWGSYKDNYGDTSGHDYFGVGKVTGKVKLDLEGKLYTDIKFVSQGYNCEEMGMNKIRKYLSEQHSKSF